MKDTVHPVDEVINKMKEVEGFGGFVICNNDGVVLRHENLGASRRSILPSSRDRDVT